LGLSLATLFFYPLISALSAQPFYMHWGHCNTLEFFVATLVISCLMGGLLFLTEEYVESGYGRTIMTIVLVAVPMWSSLTYIVAWQLGITDWLRAVSHELASSLKYSLVSLFVAAIGYVAWRYHEAMRRTIMKAILVMSPFIIFGAVTVVRAGYWEPTRVVLTQAKLDEGSGGSRQSSIFVLLFDELDHGFLYRDGQVREEFPNFRAFASGADNYHNAVSPGAETLTAIPGILGGRKVKVNDRHGVSLYEVLDTGAMSPLDIAGTGLFSLARDRGFRGVVYGWMFPYCGMLKWKIDECRAFSIYNYATVSESFSIVNPIFTNLILAPHATPLLGYLKTLIYRHFHHQTASMIYDLAVSSLNTEGPVFEFIHFNLPHSPFVYDGALYKPASDPWLQNDENYVKQVNYVDHVVGRFLAEMEKHARFATSTVIIMSDHGYRAMAPPGKAYHVPLLIKHPRQTMRRDIHELVKTEEILRGLVVNSGAAGIAD
jgi:hypothetical protein